MQLTPSHEVNSPSRVAALEDIIECVAPQLLQLVGVARSRLRIYSASAYLKVTNRASIYARVHLNRAVAVRYASAPLQPSFAGGAIGVVISNVDLDVELQGLGFLARLEAAIWSIPGVEVLEYENVVGDVLMGHIQRRQFHLRNTFDEIPSYFCLRPRS